MSNKIEMNMKSEIELRETYIETEDMDVINNYLMDLHKKLDDCKIKITIEVTE